MTEETIKEKIWEFVVEEGRRIQWGKLFIEITVQDGKLETIQAETKRTKKLK